MLYMKWLMLLLLLQQHGHREEDAYLMGVMQHFTDVQSESDI